MGELVVPEAYCHAGPASHAGVYGIMAHQQAQGGVVRVRGLTPDNVTGVYVLEVDLHAGLLEMLLDAVTEKGPDIAVLDIARGVPLTRRLEELLAGAFGNDDHRVSPPPEPFFQGGKQAIERERDLGYETEVHLAVHQRGEGGDETRVAAH